MSGTTNKLTLCVGELRLRLEGPAPRLSQVYAAVRPQLLTLLHEAMSERDTDAARGAPTDTSGRTSPSNAPPGPTDPTPVSLPERPQVADQFVEVVICEEIYHQMCLLDVARFEASWLDRLLHREQIERLYVDAACEERLRRGVDLGETLWRELTTVGQSTVEGSH